MSTVIKAGAAEVGRGTAFNLDDLAQSGQALLETVRKQAAAEATKILAKAKTEAETLRKQAESQGKQAAKQTLETQAKQLADQQVSQQLATAVASLSATIEKFEHARQACLAQWERQLIHLACEIAGRIVRHRLDVDPELPLAWVREALQLATGNAELRLYLHPADHATLAPQIAELLADRSRAAHAEILADPQAERGTCRLETRYGVIDQSLSAQLARIEEELT